eukprot:119881-Rhodomonas_salina.3
MALRTCAAQYLLYCIERKSEQESAAVNLIGKKGPVSAINLMEFNVGLAKAKEGQCIRTRDSYIRQF